MDNLASKIIKVGIAGYPKTELTPLSWNNLKDELKLDNEMCKKVELAKINKIDHYTLLKNLEEINNKRRNK